MRILVVTFEFLSPLWVIFYDGGCVEVVYPQETLCRHIPSRGKIDLGYPLG